jgi:uncharacterized glyoxalase superfamily protein PhnB
MTDHPFYRPNDFRDVTPYLVLPPGKADALITFLTQGLGGKEREVMRDSSGRVAHGEFLVGDSVIEFGENAGVDPWTSRTSLHFFVQDVDQVHAQALAAGGKEVGAPVDHAYGERSSAIEDPAGNRWYIAKVIAAR